MEDEFQLEEKERPHKKEPFEKGTLLEPLHCPSIQLASIGLLVLAPPALPLLPALIL